MTVYKKILNSLGPNKALIVCRELGISINTSDNKLTSEKAEQLSKLLLILKKDNNEVKNNIIRLIKVGCYRGFRHKSGYPTRGQRTRSNAKTAAKFIYTN